MFDGKYFIVESQDNNTGSIEARCTACNETKKGNISSTGNFLSHYQKKHPSEISELKQYLKNRKLLTNNLKQPILQEVLQSVTDVKVCDSNTITICQLCTYESV